MSGGALKQILSDTFKVAAAITAGQAVKYTANNDEIDVATAETDSICGIALEAQAIVGEGCVVMMLGLCWATAGGAITVGDLVEASTAGKLISAAGAAVRVVGIARTLAAADGDDIMIFVNPMTIAAT